MAARKKNVTPAVALSQDAEVIPPRLTALAAREIPNPADVERYNVVLELLADGMPLRGALETAGLPTSAAPSFPILVGRSPQLLAELTAAREGLREWNQFLSQVVVRDRLENHRDDMTNRDLTDIARATKPYDTKTSARIQIVGLDGPIHDDG